LLGRLGRLLKRESQNVCVFWPGYTEFWTYGIRF